MRGLLFGSLVFVVLFYHSMAGIAQKPQLTSLYQKFRCGDITKSYDKSADKTTLWLPSRMVYGTINFGTGEFRTAEPERPTSRPGAPPEIREPAKGLLMQTQLAFPGKTPSEPRSVVLTFISQDITPRYNVNRHLVAEVDGGKVDLGEADLVESRGENYSFNKNPPDGGFYTKEVLKVAVPFETFLQLSQAKKLKLKLNKVDIPFSSCGVELWQNLASLVKVQ